MPAQIQRGLKADLPDSAPLAQLLITTDTCELYVGTGSGIMPVYVGEGRVTNTFSFNQSTPLSTWTITHNLGLSPAVIVEDSTKTQVFVETVFTNMNTVTLHFSGAESGSATLIG